MVCCRCFGGTGASPFRRGKQISRAGRVALVATAGKSRVPRGRHPADMGSVARKPENFTGMTHRKVLPSKQSTSFGVSFRALSGASCDASEEVFVFRPSDV